MSGSSYRKFLQLLKNWPVDPTKTGGRDLGEYIRHRVALNYRQGEATSVDEHQCSAVYDSLHRIANDTYKNKYPRVYKSSALGLSKEELNKLLSTENLKEVDNADISLSIKQKVKALLIRAST